MSGSILLAAIGAFALGSVPSGWILSRLAGAGDPRRLGSGGTGATNVLRIAGPAAAIATLALDAGKGALAVLLSRALGVPDWAAAAAAVVVVLSHAWTPWLRFRGGRGVATGAGALGILAPSTLALALLAFVGALAATRRVSVASIAAAIAFPAVAALRGDPRATILAGLSVAAVVVWRHRENLARLREGSEPTLGDALRGRRGGRG